MNTVLAMPPMPCTNAGCAHFLRATSSHAITTAQAPDERGQMSNNLYGVETGRDFITSSAVIWPLR